DQKILEGFMRSGAFERHLNRMRAQYKGKHDLLIRLLKEFGREYTVSGENAGVHVLVHLPRGLSEAEAVQRAKEDGVRVYG
ncbi:PLP-dependent aminotransferase family protein, partial [Bifidobacterium breve]|nr:PLP-dependent aminotransferase family protein [Bifidobacterium breve]